VTREEIVALMRRAERSLRSARNLLDDGDHDFAISRAYYAMFYAATAALLSQNIKRSKHSGVIAAFAQHLVKSGHFTPECHRVLQAAFQDRSEGDYAGVFPSREAVEVRLKEAGEFVGAVTEFLRNAGFLPIPR
jgi:uncharacterized protein (UPF0332 family)